jgi:hypothetical protein
VRKKNGFLVFLSHKFPNLYRRYVTEPDILIADDDDVSRLKPGTVGAVQS